MELMSYVSVKTEEIEEMEKEGVNVDKEVEEGETGKPCGIMYWVYREHLRPAGFVSHYGNSHVRKGAFHGNVAYMSLQNTTEGYLQLLFALGFALNRFLPRFYDRHIIGYFLM